MTNMSAKEPTNLQSRFVAFLEGLAARKERGALAHLRRCLGKDHPSPEALRLLIPWLPEGARSSHRAILLTAGLFASHPAPGGHGNLGDVFLQLGQHESAQKRFVALLDSDVEDLPHRMRQAVSLARAKAVPVNWFQLIKDLEHWDHPEKFVQMSWARSYWKHGAAAMPEMEQTETSTEGGN